MKLVGTALRAVRAPLLVLAISLAISATIVSFSAKLRHQEEMRLGQLKTAQAMAQQKVMKSGDENTLIKRYSVDYQRLVRQGFIGSESRISWLDALRTTNQDLKLFGVEYTVEPQKVSLSPAAQVKTSQSPEGGDLQLRQTNMKLRLKLLHEDDLMRFFDHLAAQNVGIFSIDECSLQRLGEVTPNSATLAARMQPNLQADCQVSWFTVSTAGAKP
jgi:hypothetical protein